MSVYRTIGPTLVFTFVSHFTSGANRPGVNRPVRKMVLERTVPGGTGFGGNRPVTILTLPSQKKYDRCMFQYNTV